MTKEIYFHYVVHFYFDKIEIKLNKIEYLLEKYVWFYLFP